MQKKFSPDSREIARILRYSRVICLDFDGVIVLSEGIKDRAFQELFADNPNDLYRILAYHIENYTADRYTKFKFICENILGKRYDERTKERLAKKFNDLTLRKIIRCPFVKGALEFLESYSRTVPLILISTTPAQELEHILRARNLDCFFKEVYGAPLNKSEILCHISIKYQIPPLEIVYIGDRPEDFSAARNSGVHFIGCNNNDYFSKHGVPHMKDFSQIH